MSGLTSAEPTVIRFFEASGTIPLLLDVYAEQLTPGSPRFEYLAVRRKAGSERYMIYFGRDNIRAVGPSKQVLNGNYVAAFGAVRHGDLLTLLVWYGEPDASRPAPPPQNLSTNDSTDSGWLRDFHRHFRLGVVGIWLRPTSTTIPDPAGVLRDLDFRVYDFSSWTDFWKAIQ